MGLPAGSGKAQKYDPHYPVCVHHQDCTAKREASQYLFQSRRRGASGVRPFAFGGRNGPIPLNWTTARRCLWFCARYLDNGGDLQRVVRFQHLREKCLDGVLGLSGLTPASIRSM
jgi:hypothetical protein